MTQECFCPILPIRPFNRHDEVLKIINERGRPLCIYYFGDEDTSMKRNLIERTRSGSFAMNHVLLPLLNPNTPFGGSGDSGYGCYHGEIGFRDFCNNRVVVKKSADRKLGMEFSYPTKEKSSEHVIKWLKEKETKMNLVPQDFIDNLKLAALVFLVLLVWMFGFVKVEIPILSWFFGFLGF